MAELDNQDEYGSLGVVPAPAWSNLWAHMNQVQRKRCFEAAAACQALSLNQMEQLLHGFPPETTAWSHPRCMLTCAEAAITELRFAFASGSLVHPVSPAQWVDWCASGGFALPDEFVEAVRALAKAPSAPNVPVSNHPHGPSWAPLGPSASQTTVKQPARVRGRPPTNFGQEQALVAAGNQLLREAAEKGQSMTRQEVAAALYGTAPAGHNSVATIRRRLSKKLHLEQAKARAAQVQAKKNGGTNFRPFCPATLTPTNAHNSQR